MQSIVEQNYLPNTVYPTIKTSHTGSEVDISADIGSDLWMLAESERKSVRIYLRAVLSDMGYYAPLLKWLRPLLEYVQDSRRETAIEALQHHLEMDQKLLQELCDRVFSRTMAQVIRKDSNLQSNKRADLALRIENCGRLMGYYACPDDHKKLQRSLCNMPKHCRRCARVEAHRRAEALYERSLPILRQMPSGYEFRMVTVTTRPSGDLRADAQLVISAWAKTYRSLIKDDYSAAWRRVEVGAENKMAHIHALVLSKFLPVRELSQHWEKHTDAPVVDIRAIRGRKDLKKTCYEVSKYVTDPDKHIERDGLEEGVKKLYGIGHDLRRLNLSQTYGIFRADVFERRMGFTPPVGKEPDPCRCDKCGKQWSIYHELHEPRGPPILSLVNRA